MDSPSCTRSGRFAAFGPFALRLLLGFHLVHGTADNVFSWTRMLEFREFLAAQGFPLPLACAVLSVVAQFTCGLLYLAGYRVGWAALVMVFNFSVALLAVHWGQPYPQACPALVMWVGSLVLLLQGPGAWALERATGRKSR